MKATIYVVTGQSGEYEDFRTWNVFAFATKKEADDYSKLCQQKYNEIKERYDKKLQMWIDSDGTTVPRPKFPKFRLDPFIQHDSGGVGYSWEALQLKKHTPKDQP